MTKNINNDIILKIFRILKKKKLLEMEKSINNFLISLWSYFHNSNFGQKKFSVFLDQKKIIHDQSVAQILNHEKKDFFENLPENYKDTYSCLYSFKDKVIVKTHRDFLFVFLTIDDEPVIRFCRKEDFHLLKEKNILYKHYPVVYEEWAGA